MTPKHDEIVCGAAALFRVVPINNVISAGRHTAKAVRFIRQMRGGSQSFLCEADDGHYYVVKFKENPQHRRVLVNEWIGSLLLRSMSISTPIPKLIEVTRDLLNAHLWVCFNLGTKTWSPAAGIHFGSRYPGHPHEVAVYDFLPRPLLSKLRNRSDFVGTLVMDLWMSNSDSSRQAVFFRCGDPNGGDPRPPFTACMIDSGYCLGGAEWNLERKIAPLHHDRAVYEPCWSEQVVEFWLARLGKIPESLLWQLVGAVPPDWLDHEREVLEVLMSQLIHRRSCVFELIERHIVKRGLLPPLKIRRFPVGKASRASIRREVSSA